MALSARADGQMGLAHAGRSQEEDVGGLGDEGQVGQFLDQPLVDGGLEGEVELLKGTLKGQMGQPGTSGEVAFPTGGYLHAEQFGQQLGIGQLPAGRGVQGVVQNLHGLLEAQGFQVLAHLFQGDHATPPATSSYTSSERRSTSPAGICTATASFRGRWSPLGSPAHWPGRM